MKTIREETFRTKRFPFYNTISTYSYQRVYAYSWTLITNYKSTIWTLLLFSFTDPAFGVTCSKFSLSVELKLSVPQYSRCRFTACRNTLCFLIDLPVSCLCECFLYTRNKYIPFSSSVNLMPIFTSILYQFLAVDDLPRKVFSSHSLRVRFSW